MDLIKINIANELAGQGGHFQRLSGDMPQVMGPIVCGDDRSWQPQVDICENDEELLIIAELAGVNREEVAVEVTGRLLSIVGLRTKGHQMRNVRYHLAEIAYGYFKRAFLLPEAVDPETIEAGYHDGLLKIRINKLVPEKKVRKITVTTY